MLKQIVEQCNARIEDTGDLVPITAGHTSDDPSVPEPDILGYACNFRMGSIGKDTPRAAIMCDMRIHRDNMERVKQLPRRSIELWPDLVIDPVVLKKADRPAVDSIALLGAERPARDLGLMFHKKDKTTRRYSQQRSQMNPEELVNQCVEALSNLPEMAFLRDLMKKSQNEMAEGDEAEKYAEDKAEVKPEEEKVSLEEEGHEDEEGEDVEPARLRMQRDQAKRRYARLEADHKALFAKVEALERRERIAQRKADLLSLEGLGFDFDLAEELDYVSDMQPKQYSAHLAKIKKRYRKAPINVRVPTAVVPTEEPAARPEDVYARMGEHYKPSKTLAIKPKE